MSYKTGVFRPFFQCFRRHFHQEFNAPLPLPKEDLPIPQSLADAKTPLPSQQRLREHYERVMKTELMYLLYNHKDPANPERIEVPMHIPGLNERNKAYKKNMKPVPMVKNVRQPTPPRTHENVPHLYALEVSTTMKEAARDKIILINAFSQLELITGKYPDLIKSVEDDVLLGVREGMPLGAKVTLTGDEMYSFLDKLVELVLPKLKNWYGILGDSGNGHGEVHVKFESKVTSYFPEIEQTFDRFTTMCPLKLAFKTTADTDWETRMLLSAFQIPIEDIASKNRREKYDLKPLESDEDEPEWVKFKRAREEAEKNPPK